MYVKLFEGILRSSVWYEPEHVRLVWITLLLLADRDGYVEGVARSVATAANVDYERTRDALQLLEAPDLESKSQDWGGRRLEKVEGGWLILNYSKYRGFRTQKDVEDVRRKRHTREAEMKQAERSESYVYYARSGSRIKIGRSVNPWSRVSEMRTIDPSVTLIVVERGDKDVERQRHEEFSAQHIEREWFSETGALAEHVAELLRRSSRSDSVANDAAVAATTSASASASVSDGRGAGEGDVPAFASAWTEPHWRAYAALAAKHGDRTGMDQLLADAHESGWHSGVLGLALVDLWQAGARVSPATLLPFAKRIQQRLRGNASDGPAIPMTAPKGWCSSCTGTATDGHRRGCPFGVADQQPTPASPRLATAGGAAA